MPQYKNKSQEELRIEDLRKAGKMPGGAQANTQLTLPQQPGAAAGGFGFGSPAPAAAPTAGGFMGDTPAAKSEEPMQKKQKRYQKTPALHAKRVASNNLLTANGDELFRQAVAPAVAPRTSHAEEPEMALSKVPVLQ